MKGDGQMTIETLMKGLRAFIGRRRVLATRRLAMDHIARQPEHLAADLNIPALAARPGITIVIISDEPTLKRIDRPVDFPRFTASKENLALRRRR
jgi:hypothetical protein